MKKSVSLTIPCYNEGGFIFKAVKRLQKVMRQTGRQYEIILFDDKSRDSTAENLRKIAAENSDVKAFFHKQNQGRGQTVKDAIAKAKFDIVGFVDIDLEVSEKHIPAMLRAIDQGFDLAIGNREPKLTRFNIHRYVLSRTYNGFARMILRIPLRDTESGCKFFNRKTIQPVLKLTENKHWFWDTEIMALAHYKGLKIKEIPVVFEKNPESQSTVKIVSDTVGYVKELMHFRKKMKKIGLI